MAQLFSKRSNTLSRWSIFIALILVAGAGGITYAIWWSPYMTYVDVTIDQPVPFSHKHHVAGLGIDCRYCHTTVETSSSAGIPPTETCMTCHSQVWTEAPVLERVRESWRTGQPLRWNRVHDLPDFVYFNHSIHVSKGIGCTTCHGQVDEMPLIHRTESLYMKWCIECHRAPGTFMRPQNEVFSTAWKPGKDRPDAALLVKQNHVQINQLTDCSKCHR
jgi:hypothetical protein